MNDNTQARPENNAYEAARTYRAFPLLGVSIAVFRAGRVLLATRTKPPFSGAFSLPGGLVELGETLQQAALRELMEEVQVEARLIGFNRHIESVDRDESGQIRAHFIIASFIGVWVAGEGAPGPEAGEILWADPNDLWGLTCTPHLSSTILAAEQFVKTNF
jgi:ADP-ribose pyrophosphatase YjhB (NUDIX family)